MPKANGDFYVNRLVKKLTKTVMHLLQFEFERRILLVFQQDHDI